MPVAIALNGFGRIGRYLVRILADNKDIQVALINARAENATLAHLLQYDSSQGKFNGTVSYNNEGIIVNDVLIPVVRNPLEALDWKKVPIDVVVETTGKLKTKIDLQRHLKAGAKRVLVTAPIKDADCTIVYGVNNESYDPKNHYIISAASCTTNCLARVAKILHDTLGIEYGTITTIHSYTTSQKLLDTADKDLRRARAANLSIIPTSTGAAKAIGLVLPELEGKLSGMALRVPTPTGSILDMVCMLQKNTTVEEINSILQTASNTSLKDVLGYTEIPLVSCDYIGTTFAGVVDAPCTALTAKKLAKIIVWYDNEASFTNQLVRLLRLIGRVS